MRVNKYIKKLGNFFKIDTQQVASVNIPITGGYVTTVFENSQNNDTTAIINTDMRFNHSNYVLKTYSYDEPHKLVINSLNVIPNLKTSASFFVNKSRPCEAKASYTTNFGSLLLKQSIMTTLDFNNDFPLDFQTSTKTVNKCYTLRFETYRNLEMLMFEGFAKSFFDLAGSFTYSVKAHRIADARFATKGKLGPITIGGNGIFVSGSSNVFVKIPITKRFKFGLSFGAENIGMDQEKPFAGADLISQLAAKVKIDDGASVKAILSSDKSGALELDMKYQNFMNMKFSMSCSAESDFKCQYGTVFTFDMAK